jgi:two-component system phosphate regulon sensor histidine kinase PhoR
LRGLVSDLLDSAQHRAGPVLLSRTPIDLSELVNEALLAALPSARQAGVSLDGTIENSLRADVDPGRVRQVVDNLVSNAVKYTDTGGTVAVRLRLAAGAGVIEVSDTGIGMDESDLEELFTPFFRTEAARERHTPGVGLGLGICEAIVVAHGGGIEVASVVDGGTTFTVTLPLSDDA